MGEEERDENYSARSQHPAHNWRYELCQNICDLDETILDVALIEDGNLIAIHSKSNIPASIPSQKSFASIFFQLGLIADLYSSKEGIYGHLESFGAHFRNGDILCFSIDGKYHVDYDKKNNNDRNRTNSVIAIWLAPHKCDDSVIIGKVLGVLQKRFLNIH